MVRVKRINNNDLYAIAEREGVSILTFPLPECTAMAMLDGDDDFVIGMDPSVQEDTKAERVVVAHELGHCVSGAVYTRYQDKLHRAKAEYSATKWAVYNLIDREEFISLLKQGYRVWELAEIYDVTEDFIKDAYHFYCELEAS
ncbi:MAG: ImmA/IrrE family metallo-endopeptidase [Eubacterium sp.]|nr:ImmA/IrrE family metallo-endopeptidase [Eubacterium sp.]